MAIINKVTKLSKLSTLGKILDEVKTILAYNKRNYQIPITDIQGTKLDEPTALTTKENGGKNTIFINYKDGNFDTFVVYNGSEGDKGKKGYPGIKGEKGDSATIDVGVRGVTGTLTIVNNTEAGAPDQAFSAYQGKRINDQLKKIDETFVNAADYETLWNEQSMIWLKCTFETSEDDQKIKLYNNDTNDHNVYTKWWTFEDTGSETYYIKVVYKGYKQIFNLNEIPAGTENIFLPMKDEEGRETGLGYEPIEIPTELDENTKYYIYTDLERYDATNADLWADIYEGAKSGYFEATTNQLTDETPNFIYNELLNDYLQIDKDSLGNKKFEYYVKDLRTSVNVDYNAQSRNYSFELKANEIPIIVYAYDSEADEYTLVTDLDAIRNRDATDVTVYYSDTNQDSAIPANELDAYITRSTIRWYKLDGDNYIEVEPYYDDNEEKYDYSVVPPSIDVNSYQEYIKYEKDIIGKRYIFTHHYITTYKDEVTWHETEVVLTNASIKIYVEDNDRKYYKVVYNTVVNKDTNEKVTTTTYQEIAKVSWIKATFTTTSEDQNIKLLNSYNELGVEDNTVVDETQDVVVTKEIIPLQFIVVGDKETLYKKNSISGKYEEVDIYNDTLLNSTTYYTKEVNTTYERVTDKSEIKGTILYTSNDEVNFTAVTIPDVLDENIKYYNKIDTEKYNEISSLSNFLNNGTAVVFNGEPMNIHITPIPANTTYTEFDMEFDDSLIKLYEDGRIASIEENGTTDITLTSLDNPNIQAKLTVTLVTPSKKLTISNKIARRINIGDDAVFEGIITPSNPSNKNIKWSVTDNTVATVENIETDGNVTGCKIHGVEQGIINVKAICEDNFSSEVSDRLEIIKPVSSVTLSSEFVNEVTTVLTNKKYLIDVEVLPTSATYQDITWSSDNKGITFGKTLIETIKHVYTETPIYEYYFTVKEAGDYVITGKTTDGSNIEVSFNIHANTAVTEINVNPSVMSMNITTVKQLSIEVLPENAYNSEYEWISSDETIATVNQDGIVTAGTTPGSAVISAVSKDGSGVVGTCNVTTTVPLTNIDLSVSTSYVGIGKSIKVNSVLEPETANLKSCTWSTSDSSIATVDKDGNVTGKSIGNVTVVAAAQDGSGVIGTCKVQVIQLAQSLTFGVDELEVTLSDAVSLLPQFTPANTSLEKLIWSSSNTAIIQVNTAGSLVLLNKGEAKITATTTDGTNLTAECLIKIN